MRNSIRSRLIIAFISLAVGPLLLVGVVLGWQSFTVQQQQALTLQHALAGRALTQVTAFIQEMEGQLRMLIQVRGLKELDRDQQTGILSELLTHQDVLEELTLLDSEGKEQVRLSRLQVITAVDLGGRSGADEFVIPKASGETYYSPVWLDEMTREPLMRIAVPSIDPRSGLVDGVLVADVRLKDIWDLMAGIQLGESGNAYIVDGQGRVIAHRNPSVVLKDAHFDLPEQDGIHTGLDGTSVVLASDKIQFGEQEFYIVVERSVSEASALAINTVLITAILTVVTLGLASGLGFLAVRQIVRPIEALATTAQAIRAGDLSKQAEVTSRGEIGDLAQAFNSMTTQLRELIGGLEQRVDERTHELERRSAYVEASAKVGHAVSSMLDADLLIRQVVELIRERFGLYYVGLFLTDEASEWAVLRAGTGEAGQAMLARGHRLKIGLEGMIGWCIANAKSRIALYAEEDVIRTATAELPDTRSEAALPLRSRGRVLGALTIQHDQPNAFDDDTIAVLQTMADQVAVALDNARLYTESQAALEATRRVYSELRREAWGDLLRTQPDLGYRSHAGGVTPAGDVWRTDMEQALQEGKTILSNGTDAEEKLPLVVPIKVRDDVIGVLDTYKPAEAGEWTFDEISLLETLADQLGEALEGARLYQDTQRRAAREQLTREITDKMRRATSVEGIVQAAVDELFSIMNTSRTFVRLETTSSAQDNSGKKIK